MSNPEELQDLTEIFTLVELEAKMEARIAQMRADFQEVQAMKERILNRVNN